MADATDLSSSDIAIARLFETRMREAYEVEMQERMVALEQRAMEAEAALETTRTSAADASTSMSQQVLDTLQKSVTGILEQGYEAYLTSAAEAAEASKQRARAAAESARIAAERQSHTYEKAEQLIQMLRQAQDRSAAQQAEALALQHEVRALRKNLETRSDELLVAERRATTAEREAADQVRRVREAADARVATVERAYRELTNTLEAKVRAMEEEVRQQRQLADQAVRDKEALRQQVTAAEQAVAQVLSQRQATTEVESQRDAEREKTMQAELALLREQVLADAEKQVAQMTDEAKRSVEQTAQEAQQQLQRVLRIDVRAGPVLDALREAHRVQKEWRSRAIEAERLVHDLEREVIDMTRQALEANATMDPIEAWRGGRHRVMATIDKRVFMADGLRGTIETNVDWDPPLEHQGPNGLT